MRENLIELLNASFEAQYSKRGLLTAPHTADDLIANGVTVTDKNVGGKWIPVTERLPQEDVRVLIWLTDGVNSYTKMDTDRIHNNRWVRWGMYVTHWMPLPQPPKGE